MLASECNKVLSDVKRMMREEKVGVDKEHIYREISELILKQNKKSTTLSAFMPIKFDSNRI